MSDRLSVITIAEALDNLANVMVSDRTPEVTGYNASFWRDAAEVLRSTIDSSKTILNISDNLLDLSDDPDVIKLVLQIRALIQKSS